MIITCPGCGRSLLFADGELSQEILETRSDCVVNGIVYWPCKQCQQEKTKEN